MRTTKQPIYEQHLEKSIESSNRFINCLRALIKENIKKSAKKYKIVHKYYLKQIDDDIVNILQKEPKEFNKGFI